MTTANPSRWSRRHSKKYANDGSGHPSYDEHVGELVAISMTLAVIGPVTKHKDVSNDEPTEVKHVG